MYTGGLLLHIAQATLILSQYQVIATLMLTQWYQVIATLILTQYQVIATFILTEYQVMILAAGSLFGELLEEQV